MAHGGSCGVQSPQAWLTALANDLAFVPARLLTPPELGPSIFAPASLQRDLLAGHGRPQLHPPRFVS